MKNQQKTNTTMKRIIMPVIAALFVGLMATSCEKETIVLQGPTGSVESMHTVWAEFAVTNDMWQEDNATQDLVASLQWDVINSNVLQSGNVQAYLYEGARQVPLPYIYPVTFIDDAGNEFVRPLNVRFDIEEGVISFIITDCGEFLTDPVTLKTMRFRAVCTYPVTYNF